MCRKIVVLSVLGVLWYSALVGQEIQVIESPKANLFEKTYQPLRVIGRISNDIDKKTIIGQASMVTADKHGYIYIYDRLQASIFVFDKNLQFIRQFGRRGKGPGEFGASQYSGDIRMNISGQGELYIHDQVNARVLVFNREGECLKEYAIPRGNSFIPWANERGDMYMHSTLGGVIDVYDKNMKLIDIILDKKEFLSFLFYKPLPVYQKILVRPDDLSLGYGLIDNKKLVVYIKNSSTVYLLEGSRLRDRFHVWPEKVLKNYKKDLYEILNDPEEGHASIAGNFFLDRDDKNFFYIEFGRNEGVKGDPLYQFNLEGELVRVLYVKAAGKDDYTRFRCKVNHIFYAIKDFEVVLLAISEA